MTIAAKFLEVIFRPCSASTSLPTDTASSARIKAGSAVNAARCFLSLATMSLFPCHSMDEYFLKTKEIRKEKHRLDLLQLYRTRAKLEQSHPAVVAASTTHAGYQTIHCTLSMTATYLTTNFVFVPKRNIDFLYQCHVIAR